MPREAHLFSLVLLPFGSSRSFSTALKDLVLVCSRGVGNRSSCCFHKPRKARASRRYATSTAAAAALCCIKRFSITLVLASSTVGRRRRRDEPGEPFALAAPARLPAHCSPSLFSFFLWCSKPAFPKKKLYRKVSCISLLLTWLLVR